MIIAMPISLIASISFTSSTITFRATAINAVLSGNLYTLLLAWAATDLLEVVVQLSNADNSARRLAA